MSQSAVSRPSVIRCKAASPEEARQVQVGRQIPRRRWIISLFVKGEFAREQNVGGMIGYVQTKNAKTWIEQIRVRLTESPGAKGWFILFDFATVPTENAMRR